MNWQPRCEVSVAAARAAMLERARDFFRARKVLEVTTPVLSSAGGSEPSIENVSARCCGRNVYLQTSPEFFMKRLLAAGYPDIYQISPVFRDGELGGRHLPEFTLVEWYRRDFSLADIMTECAGLATALLSRPPAAEPECLRYSDAFAHYLDIDPVTATAADLATFATEDDSLVRALGDRRDAWLDLLMATRIAPKLPSDRLTLVHDYPASQASLARLSARDSAFAERFELYFGPMELANGFVELADATEQRSRFEADLVQRRESGQETPPLDERLLAALDSGLPPSAGVALGLDRLLMLELGASDIRDVVTFVPGDFDAH